MPKMPHTNEIAGYIAYYFAMGLLVHSFALVVGPRNAATARTRSKGTHFR
jgi:hypothetical protein